MKSKTFKIEVEGMTLNLTPEIENALLCYYYDCEEDKVVWLPKIGPDGEKVFKGAKQATALKLVFLTGEEKVLPLEGDSFRGGLTELGIRAADVLANLRA